MIEIVMATYNGAKFIMPQIDSIMNQTYKDILLSIHDDGSSDSTQQIIEEAHKKYGERIDVKMYPPSGGSARNFSSLIERTTGNYVMCADQDDIWYDHKVKNALETIQFYESVYGQEKPLLVHTDLDLIDFSGTSLNKRLWDYQHLNPVWADSFSRLLTQNVITGCTMMMNRSLIDKSFPIPEEAAMHDWWLALVACAFGKVIYVAEPSMAYRQHGENVLGAKEFGSAYIFRKALSFWRRDLRMESLIMTSRQARAFAERYPLSECSCLARIYAELPDMSRISKAKSIVMNNFQKIGWQRQLAWLFL